MLRKVEQTATAVLAMFPDLELAVEEEEPQLAAEFFKMVKDWVVKLREMVQSTQLINKASMDQIQSIVEAGTVALSDRRHAPQVTYLTLTNWTFFVIVAVVWFRQHSGVVVR